MDAAAVGVAQEEDDEQGIDQQDIFDRVVSFLTAITRGLFSRSWGRTMRRSVPSWAKGGGLPAAGMATTGAGSSSSAPMTAAASASATPRRWARAATERAGHRRGAEGRQQHGQEHVDPLIGLLWPMPNRRPWTTWRLYVFRYVSRKNSRSSGVGKGSSCPR